MHTETAHTAEAPAGVLAMMVAANGRIDERELHALDELDAFRRIGVSRDRFVELARTCLKDIGASLCEKSWLCASDVLYLDRFLDEVREPNQRLLVCRLAAAVITADGRVTSDERMVYDHALARWHVSQTMVSHAILNDRTH
ncbi:MAG: hypothetical protein WA210_10815 [Burkholderiaceae bacterium]